MGRIFLTMGPLMLAGITNMLFTKTNLYKMYKFPIDANKTAWDGRRIFGDNKTWIGFLSMVVFCTFFQLICGLLCYTLSLEQYNDLYRCRGNSVGLNLIFGALVGIAYMIFELPNSFIKRRLNISAGKSGKGLIGIIFFVVDQTDSMLGVMFVLALFTDIGIWGYWQYVITGIFTHIVVNFILLMLKVRKNI